MSRLVQLARLNTRVAALALQGRWLTPAVVAAGYDKVAPTYDTAWHRHLRPATDDLLQRLPRGLAGVILDLGSGTGYAARRLAQANPEATVLAVDISPAMLQRAQRDHADKAGQDELEVAAKRLGHLLQELDGDTLAPVFRSFQRCLLAFPGRMRLAAWPRFPKDWHFLEQELRQSRFAVEWHHEGATKITAPEGQLLPWLRQTGWIR